ncbi:hypothetical protein [Micrococcus luteus]|uniref:hypothetical protein n=1 Tax=Micrococcus luteus TaxID=1270 RepID=UPI0037BB29A1
MERHPRAAAALLSSTEFIRWVGDHPEVAAELVKRDFPRDPVPGSPDAVMARFVNDPATVDPATSREDVVAAHDAWHSLPAADQAVLLLSYPDVFGIMNGVPFEQRAQIGALTVRGHLAVVTAAKTERESKDTWEERIPGYEELGSRTWAHPKAYVPGYEDEDARQRAQEEWLLEGVQLGQNEEGLTPAWQQYERLLINSSMNQDDNFPYRTVFVESEKHGQLITIQGNISAETDRVALFVPGTFTTAASVQAYNDDLRAMTEGSPSTTVGFYWSGTAFPGSYDPYTGKQVATSVITDNMTTRWSDMGAPRLAAFDQAMDLELGHAEQTTLAHSAGNGIAGAAEKPEHGMTTDKFGYLAPSGSGSGVASPDDTVNPHAERAVVQTREDPIRFSQRFAASLHGGGGGDPTQRMDAVRLETGYTGDSTPENPVRVGERPNGGHSSLTEPGTTSLANIRAFFFGEPVVEELPAVSDTSTNSENPPLIDGLKAHPELTTGDGFDDSRGLTPRCSHDPPPHPPRYGRRDCLADADGVHAP